MNDKEITDITKFYKNDCKLTDKQLQTIELFLIGKNKSQICEIVGICPKTLWNWERLPEFQNELCKRRDELKEQIGHNWFTIYRLSTDGLLQRVKAGDQDSQEFALKCMVQALKSNDGGGILLLSEEIREQGNYLDKITRDNYLDKITAFFRTIERDKRYDLLIELIDKVIPLLDHNSLEKRLYNRTAPEAEPIDSIQEDLATLEPELLPELETELEEITELEAEPEPLPELNEVDEFKNFLKGK